MLGEYNRKRDFTKTKEPPPKVMKTARQPIFVIQKHAATRLHWDFRLEAGGVLKSWAVTKEPTLDPGIKRLAVHVEDHPIGYATFHGDIPAGEYGAGHVDIWDHGTYTPKGDVAAGMHSGKVEITLHGKRLKGLFALVRMGGPSAKENWLLIKMRDEFAMPGSALIESKNASTKSKKTSVRGTTAQPRLRAGTRGSFNPIHKSQKQSESPTKKKIEFTHVEKMMFPKAGVTKGDILRFYLEIAEHLIPYIKSRPMTLERLPEGLITPDAPRFWQKNTPGYYPQWLPRVNLKTESGKQVEYVLVNDDNALAYLVNQGTITFHPYLSRIWDLDHPDFVLFDLDRGNAGFADVVKIARQIHSDLEAEKVESYVKTSGKSGLHVLTPWGRDGGYDEAREWAMNIAANVARSLHKIATIERSKAAREGRVYIDVIQNAKGHHVVPPYVLRAVPDATVSTPLEWDELTAKLNPNQFTMDVALERARKADPMQGLLDAALARKR